MVRKKPPKKKSQVYGETDGEVSQTDRHIAS